MATRWLIDLDNGNFVFDGPTSRWSIRSRAQINENGDTDYLEHLIVVEGELVGAGPDPAADCTSKFQTLRDYLLYRGTPIVLKLELDGNAEYTFSPVDCVGGPKAREVIQIPVGADHATHVRFTATFWAKQLVSRGGGNNGAIDLFREVQEVSYDGRVQTKRWHARCRAITLSKAKALVLRFKPKVAPLTEDLTERIDLNEFEAVWTWERSRQSDVVAFSETLEVTVAGFPWIPDPVVGTDASANPFLHKGRKRAGTVRITMTLEGTDPAKLSPPSPHLTDGPGTRRDVTQERDQPPVLVDAVKGIYRAVYQEYWLILSTTFPTLNHSSHIKPFPDTPAPNGPIGGSQGAKIALGAGG